MNDSGNPSKNPKDAEGVLRTLPRIALAVAVVLVIGYAVAFHALPLDTDPAAWGQFGDYMGGLLNPLISLFTLIVAVSVWLLQKTELLETRRAVEEQGTTAEQQRQEQRFFDLLTIYHRTVDNVTLRTISEIPAGRLVGYDFRVNTSTPMYESMHRKGKEALTEIVNQLERALEFKNRSSRADYLDTKECRQELTSELQRKWAECAPSSYADSYLRVVFRILSDSEPLLGQQHYKYVKLFRAQLDRDELELIALNLWLDVEGKKMVSLAEKYGLLKHLQPGPLRNWLEIELPSGVFGRRQAIAIPAIEQPEVSPC